MNKVPPKQKISQSNEYLDFVFTLIQTGKAMRETISYKHYFLLLG
ncbi:predicted protein [Plenodomus lingam JN3]|uniref:Predicted protein n=1 Tax=Leptosphaeria maculans (strain JN3 / isolate v23.1.3 / race Av1-4-5-6-7-8) TaxID=985895 RepID=E4ZUN8_LEPMJ|nr:predicted protein [Plenodomus lingam JN3]CBX95117.1 predicted protein [Plenodomus lingam JN3]